MTMDAQEYAMSGLETRDQQEAEAEEEENAMTECTRDAQTLQRTPCRICK